MNCAEYHVLAKSISLLSHILHLDASSITRLHAVTQKTDKMPKLKETYARKVPQAKSGTEKHWDSEVKGLVLFVGK